MKKRIIIGFCAYTGSDLKTILRRIKRNITCNSYSTVHEESLDNVIDKIKRESRQRTNLINAICSVRDMTHVKNLFPNDTVAFIGIDIHYQDRWTYLKSKQLVAKTMSLQEWHARTHSHGHDSDIAACFEQIPFDFKFNYDHGSPMEKAGIIVDFIKTRIM